MEKLIDSFDPLNANILNEIKKRKMIINMVGDDVIE